MIESLEIENFKSIKNLKLDCRRINIFIGKPNTGKSNILESLGILSFGSYGKYAKNGIKDFVRLETMSNLFYDENLEEKIEVKTDNINLEIKFKDGGFLGILREMEKEPCNFDYDYSGRVRYSSVTKSDGRVVSGSDFVEPCPYLSPFKFYRFFSLREFQRIEAEFLLPPSGENLPSVLMTHKELKSTVKQIFEPFGLGLVFKPVENKIEVYKQEEDVIISYPYFLASDTLQRIVFYLVAINSNKDSILIFEEPEAHAFPYYTKFLAEKIALDWNNNQYFVSTHNPYFLLSILEKSPKKDVRIFITYFENYQTKVKPLSEEDIEEIMNLETDVFFNIERFLNKE